MHHRLFTFIAALFGFYGVALGAIATHAAKSARAAEALETAAIFALVHGVLLLCWQASGRLALLARILIAVGVIIFCSSVSARYLMDWRALGAYAPAGGVALMAGWAVAALSMLLRR